MNVILGIVKDSLDSVKFFRSLSRQSRLETQEISLGVFRTIIPIVLLFISNSIMLRWMLGIG